MNRFVSAPYNKSRLALSANILLLFLLAFSWTYKLALYPGLHADEAWSGLTAYGFSTHPIDRLTGMNGYTGILQPGLDSLLFYLFSLNVFYLRIGGAVFNLVGMLVFCAALVRRREHLKSLLFTLIISASALYACSPRVAWEVNSFSLFFLALMFAAVDNIRCGSTSRTWVFILLAASVVGSYNHVIFSAVSVAAFISSSIWTMHDGNCFFKKLALLSAMSICDVGILFAASNLLVGHTSILIVSATLLGTLLCQTLAFDRLLEMVSWIQVPSGSAVFFRASRLLSGTCAVAFLTFHGLALFDALSGDRVFLQYYCYECSLPIKLFLSLSWGSFVIYVGKTLWDDLKGHPQSFYAFAIVVYGGVITAYTTKTSLRYYLVAVVVLGIYAACRLENGARSVRLAIISALCLSLCITGAIQLVVLSGKNRPVRASTFTIGNSQTETSAHFLSKRPLVQFLKAHRISTVHFFNEDPYFLNAPLEFYKKEQAWPVDSTRKVLVDYDYTGYGDGYLIYIEH